MQNRGSRLCGAAPRALHRVRATRPSPPVKHKAGDDEHGRHRQHLRERFRGRPFGGFLHAVLPRLGHSSSLRQQRLRRPDCYSEHPATLFAYFESPLGEYRLCQRRTVIRRHFGSAAAEFCARRGVFEARIACCRVRARCTSPSERGQRLSRSRWARSTTRAACNRSISLNLVSTSS